MTEPDFVRFGLQKIVVNLGEFFRLDVGFLIDQLGSELESVRKRALYNLHDKLFLTQILSFDEAVHDQSLLKNSLLWFQNDHRSESDDLKVCEILERLAKVSWFCIFCSDVMSLTASIGSCKFERDRRCFVFARVS